jgi:chaperonin GroES
MKYNFEPAEQRVLVLPHKQDEKIGRIIIPDSAKTDKPNIGSIVRVGTGSKDYPMKYQVGQDVVFSTYSGTPLELDMGEGLKTYLIMNQLDIWGKLREV